MGSAKAHKVVDLDRETIKRGLGDGSILLVDVREPYEFTSGHIPGSVSLPLSQFDPEALPQLVAARTVFVCAAGTRSGRLLMTLQDRGLTFYEHYKGGYRDWQEAGEAVEY